jgi:hypothetical protein
MMTTEKIIEYYLYIYILILINILIESIHNKLI